MKEKHILQQKDSITNKKVNSLKKICTTKAMKFRRTNLHMHKKQDSKCKMLIETKGIKRSYERMKNDYVNKYISNLN